MRFIPCIKGYIQAMNKLLTILLGLFLSLPMMAQLPAEQRAAGEKAATDIINRFTDGKVNVVVELSLAPTTKGCDKYEYSASGNTVTVKASSAVAACRGYRAIIVMPDSMSRERIDLIRAYGAEIVLKSDAVAAPVKVRYLGQPRTSGTMYNEASLPLGAFETK